MLSIWTNLRNLSFGKELNQAQMLVFVLERLENKVPAFSPLSFCKFECNTTSDWLNCMV